MYLFPLKEVEPTPCVWAEGNDFFLEYSMEGGKMSNFTAEIADKYYLNQVIKLNINREKSW